MSLAMVSPVKSENARVGQELEQRIDHDELFYRLLHFNQFPSTHRFARSLLDLNLESVRMQYQERIEGLADGLNTVFPERPMETIAIPGEKAFVECLRQAAAIITTEPIWLQDICQACTSQQAYASVLLKCYQRLTDARLPNRYQNMMSVYDVQLPKIYSRHYCAQTRMSDAMINFASVQMALAYSPIRYLPEILGFTMAYCDSVTVPELCFPELAEQEAIFGKRRTLLSAQKPLLKEAIELFLQSFPEQSQQHWERIRCGLWLYRDLFDKALRRFLGDMGSNLTPGQAMLNLLQRKAGAAFGHHRNIQLQGENLDQWFKQIPQRGNEFLDALHRSPYVDRLQPEQSPLLKLFDFNGPMFGILNRDELEIVRAWLTEEKSETPSNLTLTAYSEHSDSRIVAMSNHEEHRFEHLSKRQLFYYLINADEYPEVLPHVAREIERQLMLYRLIGWLPFKSYSHRRFDRFLKTIYQREMSAYRPLTGKPKISRAAYVWGLEQFAPTVLIDGAWLQHCRWLQFSYPDIANLLAKIFHDEVGGGQLEQSHPRIYSKLMQELDIYLPPVESREFIEYPNFVDSAFDVPVFMLSIAKFPQRFLPELLGLNLAIELGGLGKVYMQMVDELDYWGIDPTIARLHITIDNFADGHAALAQRAIRQYLDEVLAAQGEEARQQHWQRVYSGYRALKWVSLPFKLAMPTVYLRRKMMA